MNYCTNINMATIFMNTENSNASKPNKIVLSLLQRLDLRSSNKHVALQRQQHKNNQLKIIATTWNVFELPGGSYSVLYIQDYIEHIIKKHKTFSNNPPVHIYINMNVSINMSLLVFSAGIKIATISMIFLSPQVRRCAIITCKHGIYELLTSCQTT